MKLVIVESPTKAKTITKFLGKDYVIDSSFGHIRDLPKKELGIDVENNFEPTYEIPDSAQKTISRLKGLAKKADKIILATDEDREGEAIAWHLSKALGLDSKKAERIVFHEITKEAILDAINNPKKIDHDLVDAQQARRILDRIVGYQLSPFLWKKVSRGLSAGRVQSVAVRLVVEREREIQAFDPQEYWTIDASLKKSDGKNFVFPAKLNKVEGRTLDKFDINDKKKADGVVKELNGVDYVVESVIKKQVKKNPPKPFITSSLQQAANRMLGFSAKQTMVVAQQLYEGIQIKGKDQVGLITYMRTDSLNLSNKFKEDAKAYLLEKLGEKYVPKVERAHKTKSKNAQEAHEAVRPTEASRDPELIKDSLAPNQYRLYKLIWQRSIASQMSEAIVDATVIDINAGNKYQFRANGQMINFDGYLNIYPEKSKELELPSLEAKDDLALEELLSEQHFTKPPARYSDAGLVKELEKHGIGRPSTYAPTIATIEARNYVSRDEGKRLAPTDISFIVTDLLVNHFSRIVDYKFTAQMENDLDNVAEGNLEWQPVIRDFYVPFNENLKLKDEELDRKDVVPEEESDEICDKCGAKMIIKTGRFGKFLGCGAYPDCKNIKSMPGKDGEKEKTPEQIELEEKHKDTVCEKCGKPMGVKNGRFGPFLGCTGYPDCKNIKNLNEKAKTGVKCPTCGKGEIVEKRSKRGIFYACDQYPDCKTALWGKPTGEKCPDCSSLLVESKDGGLVCSAKDCKYKK
ncbi:MAG: type I DNA topoisomerase [Patescibacteria group bacterium]|jgi:DNA topoisomerase-1|nr:type I DNA topoisomerase [Patescibacteria group bacterium]